MDAQGAQLDSNDMNVLQELRSSSLPGYALQAKTQLAIPHDGGQECPRCNQRGEQNRTQASMWIGTWCAVTVAPTLATITRATAAHCAFVRCSPSTTRPHSAATAGSMLIRMLNVRPGSARSAFISSVNGNALDSTASAAPVR